MNRRTEARLTMLKRALEFSEAHPSDSPGYATALNQMRAQITSATQLAEEQRRGTAQVRTATVEKERLRRALRRSHLRHIAEVALGAAVEDPELAQEFDLPRTPTRGLAFRAAARTMVELAEQKKELLGKYGLVDEVLQKARKDIDALDGWAEHGAEGRRIHIGASAASRVALNEGGRMMRIMDGFNRGRFAEDPGLLSGWLAATNVIGPPVAAPDEQPAHPITPVVPPPSGKEHPAA
jgi:hypothetical protein